MQDFTYREIDEEILTFRFESSLEVIAIVTMPRCSTYIVILLKRAIL